MTTEQTPATDRDQNNAFDIRAANEWLRSAKKRPIPRPLFGEFWLEGETAILFGDTGKGKSVLAVQIAESIARGRHIKPLRNEARKRTVVYVDLEMNEKQFEMRYAADHAGGRAKYLHGHYEFSDACNRVEVDLTDAPDENRAFARYFVDRIEKVVCEKEASVLILDNITYLKRSYYGARETLPLMKGLKRLRSRLGLSILVVAHSHRRETSHQIGISDLQESKLLARYADSVFAIGQSRLDAAGRYIKHVRQRSNTLIYDASHVPVFRLKKIGGNFLGFEFETFRPEAELLNDIRNEREWKTIEEIKKLSDAGASIREIAAKLDLPKTTVHRLLKMWRPPLEEPKDEQPVEEQPMNEWDFPGYEEFDDASDKIWEEDDDEAPKRRDEMNRIHNARHLALTRYRETGAAPGLAEALAMLDASDAAASPLDVRKSSAFPATPENDSGGYASSGGAAAQDILDTNGKAEFFRTSNGTAVEGGDDLAASGDAGKGARVPATNGLKPAIDAYGRPIFIESEDERGKPMVWYKTDSRGRRMKFTRKGNAVFRTAA